MTRLEALAGEHREIEAALDRLADCDFCSEAFREARALLERHNITEGAFLTALEAREPGVAAKLREQHAEALEIAERLEESLAAHETGDIGYLGRRLVAIARHNIIEEERDVFPRAARWFDTMPS
jgi:hypothetical protein